jgi:hypothetical protein
MKLRRAGFCFAVALLTGPGLALATGREPVAVSSSSRQFIASAPDPLVSSALCAYAERIKHEWLRRLELPDRWRDTIVFVVRLRDAGLTNAPVLTAEMFRFGSQLKYQLRIVIPPAPDDATLAAAIIELLSAEVANRDRPLPPDAPYVGAPIPVWFSEGFAQSVVNSPDQLLDRAQRDASGPRPMSAMELMRVTTLPGDAAGRAAYRSQAWLLVESLLRLPEGASKMQRLLAELGATKMFARAFERVYGGDFPDTPALEKWWSIQQTRLQQTTAAGNLAAADTARRLDAILAVAVEPRPAFGDLWRYYEQPWLDRALREQLVALQALHAYAHPMYRPVIARYTDAIEQLLQRKLNRFRRAAAEADRQRRATDQQLRRIQETLDRAERAWAAANPNEFESFFRALDRLRKFEQQRRNPISDYLDRFDR